MVGSGQRARLPVAGEVQFDTQQQNGTIGKQLTDYRDTSNEAPCGDDHPIVRATRDRLRQVVELHGEGLGDRR